MITLIIFLTIGLVVVLQAVANYNLTKDLDFVYNRGESLFLEVCKKFERVDKDIRELQFPPDKSDLKSDVDNVKAYVPVVDKPLEVSVAPITKKSKDKKNKSSKKKHKK